MVGSLITKRPGETVISLLKVEFDTRSEQRILKLS